MGRDYVWEDEDTTQENNLIVKDCNGNILSAGDTVMATKDLRNIGKTISKSQESQFLRFFFVVFLKWGRFLVISLKPS